MNPFVSAIVLNYNGGDLLIRCLGTLLYQLYRNYEVILVDNNSTDGSLEKAQRMFPEIHHVIRNRSNMGYAAGMNVGIRAAKGSLILLVANDVTLGPECLQELVANFHNGILAPLIYDQKGDLWSNGGELDPFTGLHWHHEQFFDEADPIQVTYASLPVGLVDHSFLRKVGLLDEFMFHYGDDLDIALKARRLGLPVQVTAAASVTHFINGTKSSSGYYHLNRSGFYVRFTQLPWPFVVTSTFFQLLMILFELTIFNRPRSHVLRKIPALWEVLRNLSQVRAARKKLAKMGALRLSPCLRMSLATAAETAAARSYEW